ADALGGGAAGVNGASPDGGAGPFTGTVRKGGGGGATNLATGFGGSGGMSVSATNNPTVVAPGSTGTAGAQGISVVDQSITGGAGSIGLLGSTAADNSAGGGGGGVGVTTGVDLIVESGATVKGGAGGNGIGSLVGDTGAGGGGGGGAGLFSSADVTIQQGATIVGGAGGSGSGSVGGGGGGGVAVILSGPGTVTNSGTLTGGNGGRATGSGAGTSGQAGFGGEGAWVSNGGTLVNTSGGMITGGATSQFTQLNAAYPKPLGGAGVVGENATVINAGTITGGKNWVASAGITNAVQFVGGVNSLEIQAGSIINGNVVAFSSADTLKLGGTTDSSFDVGAIGASAQYRGFGNFQKTGSSTWTLTGASTEATPWTVQQGTLALDSAISLTNSSFAINNSGTLQVNGSATNSAIAINTGGTVRGTGTVGATTVHAGGIISPGNSIGTLNVNGAYTQEKGGIYQVEVDPTSSASDRIAVTGTATIQDGAIVNVTKTSAAPYVVGTKYTVLTATNGVTGSFDVTGDSTLTAFYGLAPVSDANNSYLEVKQTKSITDIATTGNEAATAEGLASTGAGSAAAAPVLNQQTNDDARMALDQLSGEVYASVQSAMLQSSHFTRDAVSDRLTDTFTCPANGATDNGTNLSGGLGTTTSCGTSTGHPTGWARFYGNWGHIDSDGNASRLNTSVGGFFIGADMPVFNNWRAGVLAGYSHGTYDVSGHNASAESDDYHLGLYGGTQWGALGFRTGATYTWHDISGDRSMAVPGFSDHLSSNYNAGTAQIFGELGYRIDMGHASIEPFANLAYVNQHAESFDESGGADALHVDSQNMDTGFSTLGLRGKTMFTFNGTEVLAKGTVGWRYAVGDVKPTASESFSGGSSFDISGVPIARNQAVVDLGLGVHITRNATISISYNGQFASGATDQGVMGALNIAF
ncbi:MAG TPA: autotransporter domain-containing protein, partial [Bordetella sp.]|nr:autotransporter domain-containing protein [Bordetella sp.]